MSRIVLMLYPIPENTYQFIGQIAAASIFAIQGYRVYSRSKDELSLSFLTFFILAALSSFLFLVPLVLTRDSRYISIGITFADVVAHLAYAWMARIAWLLVISRYMSFKKFASIYYPLLATAYVVVVFEYLPDQIRVIDNQISYTGSTSLGASLFSIVTSPAILIGAYFILHVRKSKDIAAVVRSGSIGFGFLLLGLIWSFTSYYDEPSVAQTLTLLGGTVVFLMGAVIVWFIKGRSRAKSV